jgi:hypothetical protein
MSLFAAWLAERHPGTRWHVEMRDAPLRQRARASLYG